MTNVIVVFPRTEDAQNIKNLLVRHGYEVAGTCTSGAQAIQTMDRLGRGLCCAGISLMI